MNKHIIWIIAGGVFGLLAVPLGLYLGTQGVPLLGDLLWFPVKGLNLVTGTSSLGELGKLQFAAIPLLIVFWALVFWLVSVFVKSFKR